MMDEVTYSGSPAALKRRVPDGFSHGQQPSAENALHVDDTPTSPTNNPATPLDIVIVPNLSSMKELHQDNKTSEDETQRHGNHQSLVPEDNGESPQSSAAIPNKNKDSLQTSLIPKKNELDSQSLINNDMEESQQSLISSSTKKPKLSSPSHLELESSRSIDDKCVKEVQEVVKDGQVLTLILTPAVDGFGGEQVVELESGGDRKESESSVDSVNGVSGSTVTTLVEQQPPLELDAGGDLFGKSINEKKPAVSDESFGVVTSGSGTSKLLSGANENGKGSSRAAARSLEIELIDETALIDISEVLASKDSMKKSDKRVVIPPQAQVNHGTAPLVGVSWSRKGKMRSCGDGDRKGNSKMNGGGKSKEGRISRKKKKMVMVYRMKKKERRVYTREELEQLKNVNERRQRKMWQGIYRGFDAAVRKEYDELAEITSIFNKQQQPHQCQYHGVQQYCRLGVKNNANVVHHGLPTPPLLDNNNSRQGLVGIAPVAAGNYLNFFVYKRPINH